MLNPSQIQTDLVTAIKQEIYAVFKAEAKYIPVSEGHLIAKIEDGFLYSFKADVRPTVPSESPVKIHLADYTKFSGIWVSQNDFDVLVLSSENLGERVANAKISIDLSYILEALIECITEKNSGHLLEQLFSINPEDCHFNKNALANSLAALDSLGMKRNSSQHAALNNCLSNSIHFLWGPPGTGKTATLSQICRALEGQSQSIFVLSHANIAVDVAALKIAEACEGTNLLKNGGILRLGFPQMAEVRKREDISAFGVLKKQFPGLLNELLLAEKERDFLVSELRVSRNKGPLKDRLKIVRDELSSIWNQVKETENLLIDRARIIIATTSKFVIDARLWNYEPDNILLDETSMLSFPFVYAAAKKARKRLLLFGDFRQLPPVCVSEETLAQNWLGRDAFDVLGVRKNIDNGAEDNRVTLLDTQYRMNENIGKMVSNFCYDGKLQTDPFSSAQQEYLAKLPPHEHSAVVLIDSQKTFPASFKEKRKGSHSRVNPLHALLICSVADSMLKSGANKVAVITPYAAHARLLHGMIKSLNMNEQVITATIHRFQGSEVDSVIFDLVDALPLSGASRLTGSDVDRSTRLLNVAISRSKGKLVVLADKSFVDIHHGGRSPAARLTKMSTNKVCFTELLKSCQLDSIQWCTSWTAAQIALHSTVSIAKKIRINIPRNFEQSSQFRRALEAFDEGLKNRKKFESFFYLITEGTLAVGGREPEGAIAIVSGGLKDELERAIIGEYSLNEWRFRNAPTRDHGISHPR